MPKLPRFTPKKLIAALERLGFENIRQRGSHVVLRHPDGRRTVVPQHTSDIPIGTLRGILRDVQVDVTLLTQKK